MQTSAFEATELERVAHLNGLHRDKVAIVTGGSGGIGAQVGRILALCGAKVMLAARRVEELHIVQARIIHDLEALGFENPAARVAIQPNCDVGNPQSVEKLAQTTLELFGRVDYLINNAAVTGAEEMVMDLPLSIWRDTLQANLVSNYALIRQLAPHMKERGSGHIINVSSYFGGEKYVAISYPNRADYAVSKAGQRAMVETFARFLGPEIQINCTAPGPVDGERLRGSQNRPGMFTRRARVILENKRLNQVYTALILAQRSGEPLVELLPLLFANDVATLQQAPNIPPALLDLANALAQADPGGSSQRHFLNERLAQKLLTRLARGGHLPLDPSQGQDFKGNLLPLVPAEPFFSPAEFELEARRIQERNLGMLYLKRMPTDLDLAISMAHHLADRYITGETFHSSGGLKLERAVTEGELFGKASPLRLAQLKGSTIYLFGEVLAEHLGRLVQTYLEELAVGRVVLITESEAAATAFAGRFSHHTDSGRLATIATNGNIEWGFEQARKLYGNPAAVISTPFHTLPTCRIAAEPGDDWSDVLSESGFSQLIEQQITHHFRVAQATAFVDAVRLVLVTPPTGHKSSLEVFALANFIKTSLHAFTATLGAESERTVHYGAVNQVDLTRRAREEEPHTTAEVEEELTRFVNAVLLTTAPLPSPEDSRYRSRIYRGNAITV